MEELGEGEKYLNEGVLEFFGSGRSKRRSLFMA
jgi:hypothetical protein